MVRSSSQKLQGPTKGSFLQCFLWNIRYLVQPLEALEAYRRLYGDDFRTCQPGYQPALVYFSSPEALEAVFTAKLEQLDAGQGSLFFQELIGANGIVLLQGEAHRRRKQLLMPPFHGDRMRSYAQTIQATTMRLMRQWSVGTVFSVRPAMQSISLQIILGAVFGLEEGQRFDQLRRVLIQLLDGLGSPLGAMFLLYPFTQKDLGAWSPWGRFLRLRQQINALIYAEIAERRDRKSTDADRTDILSLMMAARDLEGQSMSDAELRDELMTLLFAGHETTASALSWALYWIIHLPAVRTQLLGELRSLGGDADSTAIVRLPYLNAICQETLRLYPVAPSGFPRIIKQPMSIAGYDLEPGTIVMPSIYLAHHRPAVYPEPEQFKPERFLEREYSCYEYLPFGGGSRRCIASAFALFEMKLVLFQILSTLEMDLTTSQPIRPLHRGLTIAPSSSLCMKVTGICQTSDDIS